MDKQVSISNLLISKSVDTYCDFLTSETPGYNTVPGYRLSVLNMTVIHWGSGIGHSVYPGVTMIWLPINIFAKIK